MTFTVAKLQCWPVTVPSCVLFFASHPSCCRPVVRGLNLAGTQLQSLVSLRDVNCTRPPRLLLHALNRPFAGSTFKISCFAYRIPATACFFHVNPFDNVTVVEYLAKSLITQTIQSSEMSKTLAAQVL